MFISDRSWIFFLTRKQGPVVQSSISAYPGLTLQVLLRVNPELVQIGLCTTRPWNSKHFKWFTSLRAFLLDRVNSYSDLQ